MSKRKWVAAKLFAVLGGTGLALGIYVPTATAVTPTVPPFAAKNYANRYVCNVSDDANGTTGVVRIKPNGSGAYINGLLQLALDGGVFPFDSTAPPEDNFCSYSLVIAASSYTVSGNGLGTEVQSWKRASGNNPDCPPSFVMANEIALSTSLDSAGESTALQLTSGNLADDDEPGEGYCLK